VATERGTLELEEIGPIGWARGPEMIDLARAFSALAKEEPELGERLVAAASVLEAAGPKAACIGCVEVLPSEADGEPSILVDLDEILERS
jgi:hypothetical protein